MLSYLYSLLPKWLKLKTSWLPRLIDCTLLMIFTALMQTTLLAQFRPFGAVPDMMLLFVLAVAMRENEKWGALFGLLSAVLIEAIGGEGISVLPLFYFFVGYFFPVIAANLLNNSIAVRVLFTLIAVLARMVVSYFTSLTLLPNESFDTLLRYLLVPEAVSTLVVALPTEIFVRLCLRPFHRSTEERVKEFQLF